MSDTFTPSISAFLQVLRDTPLLHSTLAHFRKHYPTSYVGLFSDNGDDLTAIALKYDCDYSYGTRNLGREQCNQGECIEWLNRFMSAAKKCNTEYMIYLEDDVWIKRPIVVDREWKLASFFVNPIPHEVVEYAYLMYGARFNTTSYGACGGTLYHVPTLISLEAALIKYLTHDFPIIQKLTGHRFGYLDMFMPSFYMMSGIKTSENPDMTQPEYTPDYLTSHHSIIHNCKDPKPFVHFLTS